MKKMHIGQTVLIIVFAALTAFTALLSVLSLVPVSTDVIIREQITASCFPINSSDTEFVIEASGCLRNTSGKDITLDRLQIPVSSSDDAKKQVVLTKEEIFIPARSEVQISVVTQSTVSCDAVGEIYAVIGGEEIYLRNPAGTDLTAALLPICLLLISVWALVRACKVRYYMAQEDAMSA